MKRWISRQAWREIKIIAIAMMIFLPLLWLFLSWVATQDFQSHTQEPFMTCHEYGQTFQCWWN